MATTKVYKCLNCQAGLEFDPSSQKWKCGYCFSEFEKEALDAKTPDAEETQKVEEPDVDQPEMDSYRCTNCGAELIADSTTAATFCLYCKSPTIIKARFSGRFKPKYVIPFQLTKEQAKKLYQTWISKCLFAPDVFKSKNEIDKITGIYAPYWLFDTTANGMIQGEATKVNSWTQGDYHYTMTKYYEVIRSGHVRYDNIPVDASVKLDDKLMMKIEPFDYKDIKDFSMQYMSGFMAEKYDVEEMKARPVMEERANKYIQERLNSTVQGYTGFHVRNQSVQLMDTNDDYTLMPIYLLVNKFNGKEHVFIVNGQTGKVVGDTPISKMKQFLFGLGIFVAVWLIGVIGGGLLG